MKSLIPSTALATLLLLPFGASAADADTGKELVETHCTGCHGSEMYTRPNSKMKSRDSLVAQVGRCDAAVGTQWFQDDIENVVEYLNQAYYHF
ncbi:MAG: cytochrome c [Chromatiales bacterium]|nr:cytochrome c [Chromatiales bacterium]